MSSSQVKIDGKSVTLSNLDKPLYVNGFTKAQVIDYFAKIAAAMLPHLKGRPVSLKRYPNGTAAPFFFQKNRPDHAPAWVKSVKIVGRESGTVTYCLIGDLASLTWAANSAAIELHVPLAKAKTENQADKVMFDLDPGPGTGLVECAALAIQLRDFLKENGLDSFVKTSGSKGLHLIVPLNSRATFEASREFARKVALQIEKSDPARVTATMAKAQRAGKVFIDWNQNARHQTTVCAYSLRGTAVPGVSTPLAWKEIEQVAKQGNEDSLKFTPEQVLERMKKFGDLLAPVLTMKQKLPKELAISRSAKKSRPDSLKAYKAKRDFKTSPEPQGTLRRSKKAGNKSDLFFCVQKHDASHLHYDFRLEHAGVLVSWAVPKGPSLRPTDKRLAMKVEDHPLDYGEFEGVIPAGYGAGVVMLWDRGTWHPENGDVAAVLETGELKFSLDGVKLKGSWVLVRTKPRGNDSESRSWLLIKHRDAWSGDVDVTQAAPLSVKSFGDFDAIVAAAKKVSGPKQARSKSKRKTP